MTLDAYIARKDGSVDFLSTPDASSMAAFFKTIDTAVMGRKTLDAAMAMTGGKYYGHGLATYVLSRSVSPGERNGVTFTHQSPEELIGALRARPGKDIFLMGGGETAREFLRADLVDEIGLGLVPVLLGEGLPIFPAGFPQRDFELIENKTCSNGMISLKYRRNR